MPRRGGTPNFALPRPAPKRLTAVGMVQLGLMQLTGACGTTGARERLAARHERGLCGPRFLLILVSIREVHCGFPATRP
jgi:hypothetical protein